MIWRFAPSLDLCRWGLLWSGLDVDLRSQTYEIRTMKTLKWPVFTSSVLESLDGVWHEPDTAKEPTTLLLVDLPLVPHTYHNGIHLAYVPAEDVGSLSGSHPDCTCATYKSKCWFHFGSREDLQVSVLWHCPEPSTLTLANGSGRRNRSFLARFLAQSTGYRGKRDGIQLIGLMVSLCLKECLRLPL